MSDIVFSDPKGFPEKELTIKSVFKRAKDSAYLFAVSDSFYLRRQVNETVIAYCKELGKTIGMVELSFEAPVGFLTQLRQAKEKFPHGLILTNLDKLISATNGEFAYDFNFMREGLMELHIPLLFWLSHESHQIILWRALDLYSRRELSTVFFEDPILTKEEGFADRFAESACESGNFEENKVRIALLEQQLADAGVDDFSRYRVANEIALPLIKAYVENSMLLPAKELLREYENDFDYQKPNAEAIIANLYQKAGDFDQAIDHYERALKKNIELYGEEYLDIANDYNNLGLVWRGMGNPDKAIEFFEQALNIEIKLRGPGNQSLSTYYNNLGLAWQDKNNLDEAIDNFKKALRSCLESRDDESGNVAIYYNNLGLALQCKGNLDKAMEYLQKAYDISSKLNGKETPLTKKVKKNLDDCISKMHINQ